MQKTTLRAAEFLDITKKTLGSIFQPPPPSRWWKIWSASGAQVKENSPPSTFLENIVNNLHNIDFHPLFYSSQSSDMDFVTPFRYERAPASQVYGKCA